MWAVLRVGDHVRRKNGGPVTVIEAKDDLGGAYCVWVEDGERRTLRLEVNDLDKTDDAFSGEGQSPTRE